MYRVGSKFVLFKNDKLINIFEFLGEYDADQHK